MILSTKLRLLFVKGQKVGGTSVEMALAPFCGDDDIVTPITKIDELVRLEWGGGARNFTDDREAEKAYLDGIQNVPKNKLRRIKLPKPIYRNHMPLQKVLELQPQRAAQCEVVCVERDPYSKILSLANMRLHFASYVKGKGEMQDTDKDALQQSAQALVRSERVRRVLNIDLYKDANGRVAARPIRYENLEQGVVDLLASRGLTLAHPFPHAKKGVSSNRLDPHEFFSRREIKKINEIFAEEFETFGYPTL